MGLPLQIADSRKPIQIMAKSFLVFPAGNQFSDFSSNRPLAVD